MNDRVSKQEEYQAAWSHYDIYVSSARLYSMGYEAYSSAMSVKIFHRTLNYQINFPATELITAIDLWWRQFKNVIPLGPYLQEVLGNEI